MMGSYMGEWYENCVQCGNLMFLDRHSPRTAGQARRDEGKWEAMLEKAKVGSPRRSRSSATTRRK
jgi:hypothetical protein